MWYMNMMYSFLQTFLQVLEELQKNIDMVPEELQKALKEKYEVLLKEEQKKALDVIEQELKQDMPTYLFVLSFLLDTLGKEEILEILERALIKKPQSMLNQLVYYQQLKILLFIKDIPRDFLKHYRLQMEIYENLIENINQACIIKIPYIPYQKRNSKRVVLAINQLCGGRHAPSVICATLYSCFEELGYEVCVVAADYSQIQKSRYGMWWHMHGNTSMYNDTGIFCWDYNGTAIKGYHSCYADDNFIESTSNIIKWISDYNPEFVLEIGQENFFADLCTSFTTVVAMNCINRAPVTIAPFVARYFSCTDAQKKEYDLCLDDGKQIIEYPFTFGKSECGKKHQKSDFGIPEHVFAITIAGNRLDDEVNDEVKQVLYYILEQNENAGIVFIGTCRELQRRLCQSDYVDRLWFLGNVCDFEETLAIGDLNLNPPRQGGGTAAAYSVLNEIPVITLANCDGAAGREEFICESFDDVPELVKQYITDPEFMEKQKNICRRYKDNFHQRDNIETAKIFIENIKMKIQEREKVNDR